MSPISRLTLLLFVAFPAQIVSADDSRASDLMKRALHLADMFNFADSAVDFAAAEKLFLAAGDHRNAWRAKCGRIRGNIERDQGALPSVSLQLASELEENPLLQSDRGLRMFCLIVKGEIDLEVNIGAVRSDWQQVSALAKELGDAKWQYRSLAFLGIAAFHEGDVELARKNVGAALEAATKSGDIAAQVKFLTILANGFVHFRMFEQALPLMESALKIVSTLPEAGYPFSEQETRITSLIGLGRLDQAERIASEALGVATRTQRMVHHVYLLERLASIASGRRNYVNALDLLRQATRLATSAGLTLILAQLYSAATQIYRTTGDLDKAEEAATLAAGATQRSGSLWAVPRQLHALAELQVAQRRYVEADRTYDLAETFADALIGNVSTALEKTALIRASGDIFTGHFALIAEHFRDPERAYAVVERVRGRVVGDILRAGRASADTAGGVQREISQLRLKLMASHTAAEARTLREQMFRAEQSRWLKPELTVLKAKSRETVSVAEIQRSLPPSSVVLEYVLADPQSYCVVISRQQVGIVRLQSRARIEELISAHVKAARSKLPAVRESELLYESLLKPLAVHAANLIIVRDGLLHLVPFDGLREPNGRYVMETRVVVYAPSATSFFLLANQRESSTSARTALLGVGGIPYGRAGITRAGLVHESDRSKFADLPSSIDELHLASAALPGKSKLLSGDSATEAAFKATAGPGYRVLHFAAHGFADPTHPDRAALVLLSTPRQAEDGFLQASEIVQLRLDADLVVLTSCDSAAGPLQGQDGIASLSRAFLLAGSRNVVSTLWPVVDDSSMYLMKRFYTHLTARKPIPVALTQAKRDMLQMFGNRASPYDWAGFIVEGLPDRAITASPLR